MIVLLRWAAIHFTRAILKGAHCMNACTDSSPCRSWVWKAGKGTREVKSEIKAITTEQRGMPNGFTPISPRQDLPLQGTQGLCETWKMCQKQCPPRGKSHILEGAHTRMASVSKRSTWILSTAFASHKLGKYRTVLRDHHYSSPATIVSVTAPN